MKNAETCPECGVKLPPDAPDGICPKCLLARTLDSDANGTPAGSPFNGFQPPSVEELAKHFPQFDILEFLGRGGMGAVYRGRQKALDRIVALKILPPAAGRDPVFAERFAREARTLARLHHPHIVTVFDVGQAGDYCYFVMEMVDGASLREKIRSRRLTPQDSLALMLQICDALQFAHDNGVIHRDIKPENILIDQEGRVKMADFGIAKLRDLSPDHATLTELHQVVGSFRYMAPEQLDRPNEVDHRADIYSLAVVLYEMLTGEVPMGHFEMLSEKIQVDQPLDHVVLRALAHKPERRYQNISEFAADLDRIAAAHRHPSEQTSGGAMTAEENVEVESPPRSNAAAASQYDTILTMNNLGNACLNNGQWYRARTLYHQAFELAQAIPGLVASDLKLMLLNNLATAYHHTGPVSAVLATYQEAVKMMSERYGEEHPKTLVSMNNLACALEDAGRLEEAISLHEKILKIRQTLPEDHPDLLLTNHNLASAYQTAGRLSESLPILMREAKLSGIRYGSRHPYVSEAKALLGRALIAVGRFAEAETLVRECLADRKTHQPHDWRYFNAMSLLGACLLGQNQISEAEQLLLVGRNEMQKRESQIALQGRFNLREATERLIHLYHAKGDAIQEAQWRLVLDDFEKAQPTAINTKEGSP